MWVRSSLFHALPFRVVSGWLEEEACPERVVRVDDDLVQRGYVGGSHDVGDYGLVFAYLRLLGYPAHHHRAYGGLELHLVSGLQLAFTVHCRHAGVGACAGGAAAALFGPEHVPVPTSVLLLRGLSVEGHQV